MLTYHPSGLKCTEFLRGLFKREEEVDQYFKKAEELAYPHFPEPRRKKKIK